MRTHERTLEQYLLDSIHEGTKKLDVTVLTIVHNAPSDVLDVRFQLPQGADRELRHELLGMLSEFESSTDHAVIVNPTFIWSADLDD